MMKNKEKNRKILILGTAALQMRQDGIMKKIVTAFIFLALLLPAALRAQETDTVKFQIRAQEHDTTKYMMIETIFPQNIHEREEIIFSIKIHNRSEDTFDGHVSLSMKDESTGKRIIDMRLTDWDRNPHSLPIETKELEIERNKSKLISWSIIIPENRLLRKIT